MWFGRKVTVGWSIGALAAVSAMMSLWWASGARAQGPAAAAAGKSPANVAANKAKSIDSLLQQGMDALSAGQYQPARESFQDAVALDPRNAKATHGLALCMLAQKEVLKAAGIFDKAVSLTSSPDRALVLNASACHLASNNHMRAAKLVKDYLNAHPKEIDEPMINALGSALQSATAQERKNGFFGQCASFYVIANQRLEASRPGFKRFGSEWFSAREADAKLAAMATQQKQLDSLSEAVDTAQERFDRANKELEHQK
ncbi:MAG TPA: tetratricopeptide repeat protein, partial [Tepidisphaeraceae bacterium]